MTYSGIRLPPLHPARAVYEKRHLNAPTGKGGEGIQMANKSADTNLERVCKTKEDCLRFPH